MKRPLCDAIGAGVLELSPELLVLDANPAALRLLGHEREALLGRNWVDVCIAPPFHADCRAVLSALVAGELGDELHRHAQVRDGDGGAHDLLCQIVREADDSGRCRSLLLTCIEDTAFAEARRIRGDEDRMLANLIANIPGLVYRCRFDADWTMVYLSDGVLELTGYPPGALLQSRNLSYAALIHPEDRPDVWESVNRAIAARRPFELRYRIRRASGEEIWVWERGRALFDGEGKVEALEGVITSIDELVRAQEARAESEAAFRKLVERSPDGIGIHDGTHLLLCNPAMGKILGYPPGELGDLPLLDLIHPDDRALATERIRRSLDEGEAIPVARERLLRKDGGTVLCDVISVPTTFEGRPATQVIVRDLTEREHFERQRRQSQKMEAIGTLAGGVAHDFNNLLSVILGYADLLDTTADLAPDGLASVQEIRKASERAQSLTKQLLAFSRRQPMESRPFDLDVLLGDMQRMIRRLIGENVDVTVHCHGALPPLHGDEAQVHQVVLNLAINARDAIDDVGALRIETDLVRLDATSCQRLLPLKPGPHVVLRVVDTGHGMTEEVASHMFEPFFTTKGEGRGTGLGLATVYGIVRQHGGAIDVQSEAGRGTRFEIYFPPAESSATTADGHETDAPSPGGSERILLVEDDDAVRRLAARILRSRGYHVVEARGPHEALALMESGGSAVDLLLTDVIMPRMNGRQLAERLARSIPALKVLYVSGYAADVLTERGIPQSEIHFLPKPFTIATLSRAVRRILDGA